MTVVSVSSSIGARLPLSNSTPGPHVAHVIYKEMNVVNSCYFLTIVLSLSIRRRRLWRDTPDRPSGWAERQERGKRPMWESMGVILVLLGLLSFVARLGR